MQCRRRGVFTAGEKQWAAGAGSMVFAPTGIRGIRCLERMSIRGIQELYYPLYFTDARYA